MTSIRSLLVPRALPILGVTVLLIAGACSSKSKGDTVSPADAAATVASAYALPPDQQACLEAAFKAHPEAARPLATDRTANDDDVQALGEVEDGCIHVDTLAAAITSGAADGFGNLTDQQRACLNDTITGLSTDDRVTMLVGFVLPQSLSDAKITEMGRVTNDVLNACKLSIDTTPTT